MAHAAPPEPAAAAGFTAGVAMVVAATLGFGMLPVLVVVTLSFGLSPAAAALWRYLVPTVALLPVLLREPGSARGTGLLFGNGIVLGLGTAFYFQAIESVPVSLAAMVYYTYPMWTLLFGRLFFAQPLGPRRTAALALVLAGSALAVGPGGVPEGQLAALTLAVVFPVAYAMLLNLLGVVGREMSAPRKTAAVISGCCVGLLPVAAAEPAGLLPASVAGWGAILAIGLIGMMLPSLLLTAGIGRIGASAAGVISALELPVAVAAGALILGEAITPARAAGAALIVAAAVLASVSRRRPPPGAPR